MDELKMSDGPVAKARGVTNHGFSQPHVYFVKREREMTPMSNVIIVQGVGGGRAARSRTNHARSVTDQERCE
jgi:hypothetical protein